MVSNLPPLEEVGYGLADAPSDWLPREQRAQLDAAIGHYTRLSDRQRAKARGVKITCGSRILASVLHLNSDHLLIPQGARLNIEDRLGHYEILEGGAVVDERGAASFLGRDEPQLLSHAFTWPRLTTVACDECRRVWIFDPRLLVFVLNGSADRNVDIADQRLCSHSRRAAS